MKVIGLTGGIASGKSTVSSIIRELGADIIDVDIIARNVVRKGEIAYNKIVQSFGEDILLPSGEINRKKLGSIVFADKGKLDLLNSITHPEIARTIKEQLDGLRQKGIGTAVVDAAILIEMGLQGLVDSVWLVIVNRETQIKRLIERDKFAYADAINRINAQFTNEEKSKYADVIIDNNKSLEEVRSTVTELWNKFV